MINLNKNSNNIVVLTLTEKSSLLNPYYLFSFTSTTNYNNVINFVALDTSNYKSRYNKFNIIESGTTFTNLTGGTINVNPTGMWDYTIYEQTTPTNLQISGTTGVVEVGKVIVNGEDINIPLVYR